MQRQKEILTSKENSPVASIHWLCSGSQVAMDSKNALAIRDSFGYLLDGTFGSEVVQIDLDDGLTNDFNQFVEFAMEVNPGLSTIKLIIFEHDGCMLNAESIAIIAKMIENPSAVVVIFDTSSIDWSDKSNSVAKDSLKRLGLYHNVYKVVEVLPSSYTSIMDKLRSVIIEKERFLKLYLKGFPAHKDTLGYDNIKVGDRELGIYVFDECIVDTRTHILTKGIQSFNLNTGPRLLLYHFLRYPNAPISDRDLFEAVWGIGYKDSIVRVNIKRLRDVIEDDPECPKRLITVWGKGYQLNLPIHG